jgi:hypothetical protein
MCELFKGFPATDDKVTSTVQVAGWVSCDSFVDTLEEET